MGTSSRGGGWLLGRGCTEWLEIWGVYCFVACLVASAFLFPTQLNTQHQFSFVLYVLVVVVVIIHYIPGTGKGVARVCLRARDVTTVRAGGGLLMFTQQLLVGVGCSAQRAGGSDLFFFYWEDSRLLCLDLVFLLLYQCASSASGFLFLVSITCLSTNDGSHRTSTWGCPEETKKGWWSSAFCLDIFAFAEGREGTLLYGMGVMEWAAHMNEAFSGYCLSWTL
jgi:hypothetical protein